MCWLCGRITYMYTISTKRREEATIHAVQLQAAHNYLLLCIGDGSLEDNSFRPCLLYPRSSI